MKTGEHDFGTDPRQHSVGGVTVPYPVPLYLLDIHDVALCAGLFTLGQWQKPYTVAYSRDCGDRSHDTDTVAGTPIASSFLKDYVIADADLELLSGLDQLAWVPREFWHHLSGRQFEGTFWHLPEASQVRHGTAMAGLSGFIGDVFLFRYAIQAIFDFTVPLASELWGLTRQAGSSKAVLQDSSCRTFGNSWADLVVSAAVAGGASKPNPFGRVVIADLDNREATIYAIDAVDRLK